jgi:ABC-type polysaccharide/polyol phosphate transport system ATPase subunit
MRELCSEDRTIVLVSHALGSIEELCDQAIWIHKGELRMEGEPSDVIHAYTSFLEVGETALTMEDI